MYSQVLEYIYIYSKICIYIKIHTYKYMHLNKNILDNLGKMMTGMVIWNFPVSKVSMLAFGNRRSV